MDHALVVRGITTVYNTDYIVDVSFHLNGAIKVSFSSASRSAGDSACNLSDSNPRTLQGVQQDGSLHLWPTTAVPW